MSAARSRWSWPARSDDLREIPPSLRRAFGTFVPDRIQDFSQLSLCCVGRKTGCRVMPRNFNGKIASVRIGSVFCPAVIFARPDSVCFVQNRDSPATKRPDRR